MCMCVFVAYVTSRKCWNSPPSIHPFIHLLLLLPVAVACFLGSCFYFCHFFCIKLDWRRNVENMCHIQAVDSNKNKLKPNCKQVQIVHQDEVHLGYHNQMHAIAAEELH